MNQTNDIVPGLTADIRDDTKEVNSSYTPPYLMKRIKEGVPVGPTHQAVIPVCVSRGKEVADTNDIVPGMTADIRDDTKEVNSSYTPPYLMKRIKEGGVPVGPTHQAVIPVCMSRGKEVADVQH
nr:hypothetical protein [Tanacetum cinerariifolium]